MPLRQVQVLKQVTLAELKADNLVSAIHGCRALIEFDWEAADPTTCQVPCRSPEGAYNALFHLVTLPESLKDLWTRSEMVTISSLLGQLADAVAEEDAREEVTA